MGSVRHSVSTRVRPISGLLIAAAMAGGVLAACGGSTQNTASSSNTTAASSATTSGSGSSGSGSSSSSLTKVTIGVAAPISEQALPFYVQSKGFFKKNGIDATVKLVSPTEGPSALSTGRVDFMSMSSPTPEDVHLSGAPVQWLAMWATKPDMQLVADANIKSVADLAGKNVAITADGSTTQTLTDLMFNSAHVPLSQAKLDPVGGVSQEQAAFISGSVAAYLVAPPGTSVALKDRKGAHVVLQLGSAIPWVWAGLAAYMPYANAHPTVTKGILTAMVEGLKSWESDPSGAEATIGKVGGTSDPTILKTAYQDSLSVLTTKPVPSTSAEQFVLNTLATSKAAFAKTQPSAYIDNTYINAVLGSGS